MTRRSFLQPSQRIDLVQRRRTREAALYSEQPVPIDIRRLPGAGEGAGYIGITDFSWLSPEISWMDPEVSWLA
jgi:hypothetical protein